MTETGNHRARDYPWGKFESVTRYHRLEHHRADVAACFEALLLDTVLRARFERAAGGAARLCRVMQARLAWLAFLHDFGKVNAGFQFQVHHASELPRGKPRKAGHITEALLAFKHETVCETLGLYDLLEQWGEGVAPLLQASLSHHGRPPKAPNSSGSGPPEIWTPFAGYDPLAAARSLAARGPMWFPEAFWEGPLLPTSAEFAHLFAGVVTLADQIGSDEKSFPFASEPVPTYIEQARERARRAVRARGFLRADWPGLAPEEADFRNIFGHERPRHPSCPSPALSPIRPSRPHERGPRSS